MMLLRLVVCVICGDLLVIVVLLIVLVWLTTGYRLIVLMFSVSFWYCFSLLLL